MAAARGGRSQGHSSRRELDGDQSAELRAIRSHRWRQAACDTTGPPLAAQPLRLRCNRGRLQPNAGEQTHASRQRVPIIRCSRY